MTGRKRAADTRASAAAAPPTVSAAPPSLSSESQQPADASEQSQNKKQRGESSSQGNSAAVASSVGVESVAAQDSVPSSAGAADALQLCVEARLLLQAALPFAESEVLRSVPEAEKIRRRMRKLAAAEVKLQSIPAAGTEKQANQRAIKQVQIEGLKEWLDQHDEFSLQSFRTIDKARVVSQQEPATLDAPALLGDVCDVLMTVGGWTQSPLDATKKTALSRWLLRVDRLFSRLCDVIPHLQLSGKQVESLLECGVDSGALQLVPAVMRSVPGCEFPERDLGDVPLLIYFCQREREHYVCREPYLRMFEFGLDPTLIEADSNPPSALQLARNFVRDHPLPALDAAADPLSQLEAGITQNRECDSQPVWSVLEAYATVHFEAEQEDEDQRRDDLHARFMHAFVSSWIAHSTTVRALLLDAAPGRLIAPLVDIVSRYLDLDGVPLEPAVLPADMEAEM